MLIESVRNVTASKVIRANLFLRLLTPPRVNSTNAIRSELGPILLSPFTTPALLKLTTQQVACCVFKPKFLLLNNKNVLATFNAGVVF
jgi:hypothetical protein